MIQDRLAEGRASGAHASAGLAELPGRTYYPGLYGWEIHLKAAETQDLSWELSDIKYETREKLALPHPCKKRPTSSP